MSYLCSSSPCSAGLVVRCSRVATSLRYCSRSMSTWLLTTPKDFFRRCLAFGSIGEAAGADFSMTCATGHTEHMGNAAQHSWIASISNGAQVVTGGKVAQPLMPCLSCSCSMCMY